MPQNDLYLSHLERIRTELDAVNAGTVVSVGVHTLAPDQPGPTQWVTRNTPVVMTATFQTEWAGLSETDRDSALIRLVAINRTTWHPSLVVTKHARRIMSATASSGAVLFFTPHGSGYAFLTVIPSGQQTEGHAAPA